FQIRGKLSFVIGKPVAIRRAVRVCRANQNVLRWDALHFGAGLVAEHGRKAEKIGANDGATFVLSSASTSARTVRSPSFLLTGLDGPTPRRRAAAGPVSRLERQRQRETPRAPPSPGTTA